MVLPVVDSKGETTTTNSFNPFSSEETTTDYDFNFPTFDETIPSPLSLPGGGGGNSTSNRSRTGSRRGGNGGGSVMTSSTWNDDFYWRTDEAATDYSWRVDTPTIASSRSSYPHPPHMVDTSMESNEDYMDDNADDYDPTNLSSFQSEPSRSYFPKSGVDRSNVSVGNASATTTPPISILLQERLSILFDGLTPEPSCRVMGRIYVPNTSQKPSTSMTRTTTTTTTTSGVNTTTTPSCYHLIIHDRKRLVEQWTIQNESSCREDVEAFTSFRHMSLRPTDRLFRIDTSKMIHSTPDEPTGILEYQCSTKLKPIPMLIKTKLQRTERGKSHLGIRLRANPANRHDLEKLAVLVVVPPHVQPDDPPPQGGTWDDVKRTLSWGCDTLPPGQGMDLQITFHGIMDTTNDPGTTATSTPCPFPILVHCRGYRLFSRLNVSGETTDGRPLNLDVQRATTVLYRKL